MLADSHAHLDWDAFDEDREQVISRAREAGIELILTVGCNLESSRTAIRLAEEHQDILAAVGFHPNDTTGVKESDLETLAELSQHPRVVAIGEIGLDFYREWSPHETQIEVFRHQLRLAQEVDLPVVIHCRNAHLEMLEILDYWVSHLTLHHSNHPPGVIHCFSGDVAIAQRYISLGFLISLAGPVTYPSARNTVKVAQYLPPESLLIETDSPFLAPQDHRGKRNEPAYLTTTAKKVAQVREMSLESVCKSTTQNVRCLLRLEDKNNVTTQPTIDSHREHEKGY